MRLSLSTSRLTRLLSGAALTITPLALAACEAEDTTPPASADTSEPTADATAPTTDTVEPGTDTAEPPADTTEPGADTTEPPADTTEPTADTTEPTADTTEPPADTTEPTADTTEPGVDTTQPPTPAAPYEVWATDQGLSRVVVWRVTPAVEGEPTTELAATVDYKALYPDPDPADSSAPKPLRTPHMIDFSLDRRFAFIAHTSSGHTSVIRTDDKSVAATLATGPGTHMVRVSPTGKVYVDVIGNADFPGRVLELSVDGTTGVPTIARTLIVRQDPLFTAGTFPGSSPVCGTSNADDSKQFVTFGPGFGQAMLARVDNASFTLEHIYDPAAVRANCGAVVGPEGRLYFTGGRAATVDVPGIGVWYVLDPQTLAPIPTAEGGPIERTTHGTDAHGLAFAKDGRELWLVNRDSDNIAILDASTHALVENLEDVVDAPDLLALSPDGERFYVTLRGANPRSGPHAIAGTTPGVAVINVASRQRVTILQTPSDSAADSDYHGLRVRAVPPTE